MLKSHDRTSGYPHMRYNVDMLNDIQIIRLREIGQLDMLEALLLDLLMAATSQHERRAVQLRLIRVDRLKRLWRQHNPVNRSRA